jgi:UDP-glucose 4-epimerase
MLVLVTGGAGFIGSHSVDALLAGGARVRVLDNLSAGHRDHLPADSAALDFVAADIRDRAAVDASLAGVDAVLHLAAQVSVQASVANPVESASHNVAGFLNVLDGARAAGVRRVVYASSAAVYGTPRVLPLDEGAPTAPISPYGLEKLIDDQYAALYAMLYGLAPLGLRYFNVYGPRQDPRSPYAGVISKFVDGALAGTGVRVFGDGLQTRDFVYVGDVAHANVAALRASATGVINVGTGASVTLLALLDALATAVGASAPIARCHEPAAAGDIRDSAMDPTRLHAALGVRAATSLAEGLGALVKAVRR